MPTENTSLRGSSGSLRACSGEMYANLPRTAPPCVASDSARFAMPKSVSFTSPARDSSTFDGDTSRWTSAMGLPSGPRDTCACSSASQISAPMCNARSNGRRRRFDSSALCTAPKSLPSTYSMTRKYWPSSPRPTSKIWTMLRCLSSDSTLASAISNSTKRVSCERCGRIRLIATGFSKPPAATALPRKISAMPPTPMRSSSSYRVTSVERSTGAWPQATRPALQYHPAMDAIARLIDDALAAGLGSAAAVSVGDAGVEVFRLVRGHVRRLPDLGPAIDERTPFDLASLTKPMATVACAMALAGEGRLDLAAPVRRWLPGAATAGTVRDLLGHAAGCAAHVELFRRLRAERPADPHARLVGLAAAEPCDPPGIAAVYSD